MLLIAVMVLFVFNVAFALLVIRANSDGVGPDAYRIGVQKNEKK